MIVRSETPKARIGQPLAFSVRAEYESSVGSIKEHIQQGDIYEMNFCLEHGFEQTIIEPVRLFEELKKASPAPFSVLVKDGSRALIGASPERFMMKSGTRLFSQPMKGTNRRMKDNEPQMALLRSDPKEVAENVMITDLVRNDLSRSAKKGSVRVDELCGVYEFEHVNTMISTVSAELRPDVHPLDALLNAFPMGSMTGAPKIRAMELIDRYEGFSRGLYSGAVGYFTPDLDFDFNVGIRSILYNEEKQVVTFPTGSAITINSDPEKEYDECMLKAEAMRKVLLDHAK
jgi:para-aminobenzoate synthetase component 1